MRPQIRSDVPLIWRTDELLQLGTDPVRARALPASNDEHQWLESLDGARGLAPALLEADLRGIGPDTATGLLEALTGAGALEDAGLDVPELRTATIGERARLAPDVAAAALAIGPPGTGVRAMSARRRARVEIRGTGRVGSAVASLLAAAGVGSLVVSDGELGEDVTPFTAGLGATGIRAAIERCAPSTRVSQIGRDPMPADLVVLADRPQIDPEEVAELVAADVPHLLVHAAAGRAVVGPLVIPGRTACLRCVYLTRRDRDATWPRQAAQLVRLPAPTAVDVLLATMAAALAARRVCGVIEHASAVPPGAGQAIEYDLVSQKFTSRAWSPHPICGCTWSG